VLLSRHQNAGQNHHMRIASTAFENMALFHFPIQKGLKQGDALLPLLFNFALG
jgi:hypothetical protein